MRARAARARRRRPRRRGPPATRIAIAASMASDPWERGRAFCASPAPSTSRKPPQPMKAAAWLKKVAEGATLKAIRVGNATATLASTGSVALAAGPEGSDDEDLSMRSIVAAARASTGFRRSRRTAGSRARFRCCRGPRPRAFGAMAGRKRLVAGVGLHLLQLFAGCRRRARGSARGGPPSAAIARGPGLSTPRRAARTSAGHRCPCPPDPWNKASLRSAPSRGVPRRAAAGRSVEGCGYAGKALGSSSTATSSATTRRMRSTSKIMATGRR